MRLVRLYAPQQTHLVEIRLVPKLFERWPSDLANTWLDDMARWLGQSTKEESLQLHAWAITPHRLRLLATPPSQQALSRVVQAIGRRMSATHKLGKVFVDRYKSALVEPRRWVLPALVWVERSPVSDGLTSEALSWAWSSARQHTGTLLARTNWSVGLTDHEDYWACGNTPFDRQATYRKMLAEPLAANRVNQIEAAVQGQWALGSDVYLEQLTKVASRAVVPRPRGRPPKVVQPLGK